MHAAGLWYNELPCCRRHVRGPYSALCAARGASGRAQKSIVHFRAKTVAPKAARHTSLAGAAAMDPAAYKAAKERFVSGLTGTTAWEVQWTVSVALVQSGRPEEEVKQCSQCAG